MNKLRHQFTGGFLKTLGACAEIMDCGGGGLTYFMRVCECVCARDVSVNERIRAYALLHFYASLRMYVQVLYRLSEELLGLAHALSSIDLLTNIRRILFPIEHHFDRRSVFELCPSSLKVDILQYGTTRAASPSPLIKNSDRSINLLRSIFD